MANGNYYNHRHHHGPTAKIVPGVNLVPQEVNQVETHISKLPSIKHVESNSVPPLPIFKTLIDNYFANANTNFKANSNLSNNNQQIYLRSSMSQVYGRKSILFCIDVEAFEMNTNLITEIGISIYDPREQFTSMVPTIHNIHIKIQENFDYPNGRFVPNHGMNFNGGTTYLMKLHSAATFTQGLINHYFIKSRSGDVRTCLIGHDVKGDIKWLNTLGIKFPNNVPIIDTSILFSMSQGKNGTSLKNALIRVQIPHAFLHNAGNDAYYTLLLLMKLCDPQCRQQFSLDVMKPMETKQQHVIPLSEHIRPSPGGKVKAKNYNIANLILLQTPEEAATKMFATTI